MCNGTDRSTNECHGMWLQGGTTMKTLVIVASIVATAAALGACRKNVTHKPMKLGSADITVEQAVRV